MNIGLRMQVYVHHYVSSYHFLLGNGAELRGSFTRPPLPSPYAMIVNGTEVDNMRLRMTNIQLINTGKPTEALLLCDPPDCLAIQPSC